VKIIVLGKHSSLFCSDLSYEEKSFITLTSVVSDFCPSDLNLVESEIKSVQKIAQKLFLKKKKFLTLKTTGVKIH
jgi:hypothetical protein